MRYTVINGFRVGYQPSAGGYDVTIFANLSQSADSLRTSWTAGNEGDALDKARGLIAEIKQARRTA